VEVASLGPDPCAAISLYEMDVTQIFIVLEIEQNAWHVYWSGNGFQPAAFLACPFNGQGGGGGGFPLIGGHWHCQFLEADLKTSLPRKLNFASDEKLFELAQRGRALKDLADKQALEHAISIGRGAVNLNLTAEQYEELKRIRP
jgi:hypothetical protein